MDHESQLAPIARYCGWIPAALITFAHFAISDFM
jgi:hypothetical protein